MRNCLIGCAVLCAMAGTALSETKEPPLAVAPFDAAKAKEHQEAWAKYIGQPREVTDSIGMKLTLIPPGEFMMGSGESPRRTATFFRKSCDEKDLEAKWFNNEHPQHRVRITKPFYLGTYHVTRGQFRQFVADTGYKTESEGEKPKGVTPGASGWVPGTRQFIVSEKYSWRDTNFEQTDEHPVVSVTWNDAVEFCKWLGQKEGRTYRLPTEAEWEYACRAGTTTRYHNGDDPETLSQVANVADATFKATMLDWSASIKASDGYLFTSPVGKFKPNAFGLYDMHGNVWQWCSDRWGEDYYAKSPTDDPGGPKTDPKRVQRGGSWLSPPSQCRSANRTAYGPSLEETEWGFRVARTP